MKKVFLGECPSPVLVCSRAVLTKYFWYGWDLFSVNGHRCKQTPDFVSDDYQRKGINCYNSTLLVGFCVCLAIYDSPCWGSNQVLSDFRHKTNDGLMGGFWVIPWKTYFDCLASKKLSACGLPSKRKGESECEYESACVQESARAMPRSHYKT